jgi:hypothetical protein
MIPSGIEPATFRFVAQYLNHCATISGPHSTASSAVIIPTTLARMVVTLQPHLPPKFLFVPRNTAHHTWVVVLQNVIHYSYVIF